MLPFPFDLCPLPSTTNKQKLHKTCWCKQFYYQQGNGSRFGLASWVVQILQYGLLRWTAYWLVSASFSQKILKTFLPTCLEDNFQLNVHVNVLKNTNICLPSVRAFTKNGCMNLFKKSPIKIMVGWTIFLITDFDQIRTPNRSLVKHPTYFGLSH